MIRRLFVLVAVSTLATAGALWAGTKSHSVNVTLDTPTVVSGKTLPAGDYHLSWSGDSAKVNVTFQRDAKVVTEASATIKDRAQKSQAQELISRTMKNGQQALEEVRLGNQKTVLVFPVS